MSPPSPPPAPPPHVGPPPPVGPPPSRRLSPVLLAGLIASAIGFVLELSYHNHRTENGLVVECDYHNYAPLLLGPPAIVLGLLALARSRRPGQQATLEAGLGLLCVAIGVLHVVRGLGVVDLDLLGQDPC